MDSFAEYALKLRMIARRSKEIAPEVIREIGALAKEEAKNLIGHTHPEWPPLADSTVADKGSADEPLLRTGQMQQSILFYTQYWGTRYTVMLTATDPKIVFHELGTQKMPPRPVLALAMHRIEPVGIELLQAAIVELFR